MGLFRVLKRGWLAFLPFSFGSSLYIWPLVLIRYLLSCYPGLCQVHFQRQEVLVDGLRGIFLPHCLSFSTVVMAPTQGPLHWVPSPILELSRGWKDGGLWAAASTVADSLYYPTRKSSDCSQWPCGVAQCPWDNEVGKACPNCLSQPYTTPSSSFWPIVFLTEGFKASIFRSGSPLHCSLHQTPCYHWA